SRPGSPQPPGGRLAARRRGPPARDHGDLLLHRGLRRDPRRPVRCGAGGVPAPVRAGSRRGGAVDPREGALRARLRDHLAAVPGPDRGEPAARGPVLAGRARAAAGSGGVRAADTPGALHPAARRRALSRPRPARQRARSPAPSRDQSAPARAAAGAVRAAARPGTTEATAPAATASTSTRASWIHGIVIETG